MTVKTLQGVVTRDTATAAADFGFSGTRFEDACRLALCGAPAISPLPGQTSLLHAAAGSQGLFDQIAVDGSFSLYRGAWSEVLVSSLAGMVVPGGELILPIPSEDDRRLSVRALTGMLGAEPDRIHDRHASFRPRASLAEPGSILSWALRDFSGVVHAFMLARTLRESTEVLMLDDVMLEVLADNAEILRSARRRFAASGFTGGESWFEQPEAPGRLVYGAEYTNAARIVAWHLTAAGRRAALVRALLDAHGVVAAGSVVDLGGRYGFLGAELALDRALLTTQALVCDFSTAFLAAVLQIYRAHRRRLHGRYLFSLHHPGEYNLPEGKQVIGLFGSLLDVVPERRAGVLRRCREALCDGGLLIVEQPLDDASGLSEDDLDGLLEPLGSVRVFAPHTFAELDARKSHPGAVRVVCG